MSGSNSSAHACLPHERHAPDVSPLALTVHSMPQPELADASRRTATGRWKMLAVLAVCAAPVVASYFTYFVIRPEGRNNYSELITPPRALPEALPLTRLDASVVAPASLHGQWLLVVVADAACNAGCERRLLLQRQLRETLGREKDRVDKIWFVTDGGAPRPEVLQGILPGGATTVLHAPRAELATWLAPGAGHSLDEHLYLVDPMGQWMMRTPVDPDPSKLKRDIERLLRASASWDKAGR